MDAETRKIFFRQTPWWLWPILWWSMARADTWITRYWEEHGLCDVAFALSGHGTVRIAWIGDPYETDPAPWFPSRSALLALIQALRPDFIISQPVRTASCAFARRACAACCLAASPAFTLRPMSLAPG